MESKELVKLLNDAFKKNGYSKAPKNTWYSEQQEIIIVFAIRTSAWSKHFYIDFGIVFKKLFQNKELNKIKINDGHVRHEVYNLFMKLGEPQGHVERIFSFNLPDQKVVENIDTIFNLFSSKAIPYLKKFNDYKYLVDHFQKDIAFKPFFVLYYNTDFYMNFFKQQQEA